MTKQGNAIFEKVTRAFKLMGVSALLLVSTGCAHYYSIAPHGYHGDSVTICHKGKKTMTLPREAASGHMNHGDYYGHC